MAETPITPAIAPEASPDRGKIGEKSEWAKGLEPSSPTLARSGLQFFRPQPAGVSLRKAIARPWVHLAVRHVDGEVAQKSRRRLDGNIQSPKLPLGMTFNDGIEVIGKPIDRHPAA